MKTQDDIDFTTLAWVKQELDDTLKQAQQALEAYVEEPSDKSQMRFCASYLHQVQGTLRMVELYGAAMVVEEMERLALALLEGQIKQPEDAYTVLMRGIVQLPDYLERLQSGHRDIPIVLLPLLNDLRACRGEKLLSQTALFSPDLNVPLPASAAGAKVATPQAVLAANAGRLRLAFQFGLLKWFKGEDVDGNLTRLVAILDRLRSMVMQIDSRRLWWVSGGALEAVLVKGVEASAALKSLIGKVDREIKRLIDQGEASFAQQPPSDLVKGLLYYIAQSTAQTQRVGELRQLYRLDKLMPTEAELEHARGALSGHNRALLNTVGAAIKDDLLRVKDALDLFLRTSSGQVEELASQGETLHRVADTLGMLGLGVPRRVVLDQQDIVERIALGKQKAEESVLLDVAGALLYVESSLDDHIERLGADQRQEQTIAGFELPQAEVRRILEAATKEAAANIQQAKQDIVAFIESPWDHSKIESIPQLLEEIGGALRMLNMPEPADLLTGVTRFVEIELLKHRRVPSGEQLDLMADAIASIEFYLEAVKEGRRGREKILDVTRRSLESLGYWPLPGDAGLPLEAANAEPSSTDFPTFADTFETAHTQVSDSHEAAPVAAPQELAIELPAPGAELDALFAREAAADALEPAAEVAASAEPAEMHAAVDIAPGQGLEDLVIGELAPEPVAPPPQDLSGLRVTDADLQSPSEVLKLDLVAEEETLAAPAVDLRLAVSEDRLSALPETVVEPEVVIEVPPVAEAAAVEAVIEAAVETPVVEAIAPAPTPAPVAPVASAVPPPIPAGSLALPDVGFHSVPSDEIDDEIREVFVEEVQDELHNLNRQYPSWKSDLGDLEKLKPVRRSFHTLKGSGRLVGALAIGEFAWKIENMLNRVLDKTIQPSPAVLDLLDHAIAALPGMLAALKGEGRPDANVGAIMWVADQLSTGQEVWLPKSSPAPSDTADVEPTAEAGLIAPQEAESAIEAVTEEFEEPESAILAAPEVVAADVVAAEVVEAEAPAVDVDLSLLLEEPVSPVDLGNEAPLVAEAVEVELEDSTANADVAAILDEIAAAAPAPAEQPVEAETETSVSPLEVDPVLMEILRSEVQVHVGTVRSYLAQVRDQHAPPVSEELLRAVHTLNGALSMVELPALSRVVAPLEGYLKRLRAKQLSPDAAGLAAMQESADTIDEAMLRLDAGMDLPDTTDLAQRVNALKEHLPAPEHPYSAFGIHLGEDHHRDEQAATEAQSARPWFEADDDALAEDVEMLAVVDATEAVSSEQDLGLAAETALDRAEQAPADAEASLAGLEELTAIDAQLDTLIEPSPEHSAALSVDTAPDEALAAQAQDEVGILADLAGLELEAGGVDESLALSAEQPEISQAQALADLAALEVSLEPVAADAAASIEVAAEATQPVEPDSLADLAALDLLPAEEAPVAVDADLPAAPAAEVPDAELADLAALALDLGFEESADTAAPDADAPASLVELEALAVEADAVADGLDASSDSASADDVLSDLEAIAESELGESLQDLAPAELAPTPPADEAELALADSFDLGSDADLGLDAGFDGGTLSEADLALLTEAGIDPLPELRAAAEPGVDQEPRLALVEDTTLESSPADVLLEQALELPVEPEAVSLEAPADQDTADLDALLAQLEDAANAESAPAAAEGVDAELVALQDEVVGDADAVAEGVVDEAAILAADDTATESVDSSEALLSVEAGSEDLVADEAPELPPAVLEIAAAAAAGPVDVDPPGALDLPDLDVELLDIFVEEGTDILDHADGLMAELRQTPENREIVAALQRDLHTLKGGARMAGLSPIGDLSHAMESLFEAIAQGQRQASRLSLEALERAFDRLHGMVQRVRGRQAIAMPEHIMARLELLIEGREAELLIKPEESTPVAPSTEAAPAVESDQATAAAPAPAKAPAPPAPRPVVKRTTSLDEEEAAARAAQQELIRVRADLLDNLVNFAGEVSIYRSRLEAQMGGFRFNLVEFEQTVSRLREQLRKLEIETEAQILSRFQREQDTGAEFDPLELDRFSTLQQLSRALAESVSDLVSIQNLLDDIARQSETLLLQQSRVSSELQEGLMRTRMVPFESLVPRLRRILRQTAGELGKKAQLKVEGTQGEMDRTVLERMTAPFEHMLRNSLAHGIERPELRATLGKPEEGAVTIQVSREATEVLIRVLDDGAGMDRDVIRRKAIERGLMNPDAQLSDRDIYQFVLETGFSTATEVSKVAGRGVGMDVVANEVKQLGGSLEIDAKHGQGTTITIRLPLTLAVTQAILVRLGEATYAVPMNAVAGVYRMPRKEMDRRLEQKQMEVVYGGEAYQIYDLADLLRTPINHAPDETQVPLLMTKTGDQRAAVRVSHVIGSKEVVVKPVGLQLSSVPGIFGATIMGDGRVVVILDLAPLVRHGVALRQAPELAAELELLEPTPEPEVRRLPLVMVVDDSITMRKVTTRVLERNNLDVVTAKDGLDAVEQLQDRVPDLMLLDIEMPRMDGYELATYMRNDPRLRAVPIIMITSRTGEKHRQRAMEVGVDRYLGKPYQEADLLRNVQEALTQGHTHVH